MKTRYFSLIIFLIIASCSSSTLIQTTPEDADVYVDGNKVGATPYLHEDQNIAFTSTRITLKKEGYEDVDYVLRRDEKVEVGPVIAGFFFMWPFLLWSFGYNEVHNFEMEPAIKLEPVPGETQDNAREGAKDEGSKYDRLRDLKDLFDEGVLTEEEYKKEKEKILNEE